MLHATRISCLPNVTINWRIIRQICSLTTSLTKILLWTEGRPRQIIRYCQSPTQTFISNGKSCRRRPSHHAKSQGYPWQPHSLNGRLGLKRHFIIQKRKLTTKEAILTPATHATVDLRLIAIQVNSRSAQKWGFRSLKESFEPICMRYSHWCVVVPMGPNTQRQAWKEAST